MQERNFLDIPWNFLIGDDGNVYEGRGFQFQGELSGNGSVNSYSEVGIFVAFIGTFTDKQPTAQMVSVFNSFVDISIRRDVLKEDFKIFLQDSLIATDSKSQGLLDFLETTENFHPRMKFHKN